MVARISMVKANIMSTMNTKVEWQKARQYYRHDYFTLGLDSRLAEVVLLYIVQSSSVSAEKLSRYHSKSNLATYDLLEKSISYPHRHLKTLAEQ